MPSNENMMRMTCMKFTRSSAAFSNFDCRLGHREQLNLLSSFIDATQVYGPSASRAKELRANQGGKLRTSQGVNGRENLPQAQDGACRKTTDTIKCFAAGEGRTNENLGLSSLHGLFLREHNRIATALAGINPSWGDERLFFEARRILIAINQHIVYSEWLPNIIGWSTAGAFDLVPSNTNKYFTGYNPNVS
jgi:peroxidase